jgi:hypothetical protein
MSRNPNADNDIWEAIERVGRNFKGSPSDLDDVLDDEHVHPRTAKKRKKNPLDLRHPD